MTGPPLQVFSLLLLHSGSPPFFQLFFFLTLFLVCHPPLPRSWHFLPCCQCVTDRCSILSASPCNCILLVIELSWSPRGILIFHRRFQELTPPSSSTSSLAPSIQFSLFLPPTLAASTCKKPKNQYPGAVIGFDFHLKCHPSHLVEPAQCVHALFAK